jgi:hypothetical protein
MLQVVVELSKLVQDTGAALHEDPTGRGKLYAPRQSVQ